MDKRVKRLMYLKPAIISLYYGILVGLLEQLIPSPVLFSFLFPHLAVDRFHSQSY
jgi:hypothetical protein